MAAATQCRILSGSLASCSSSAASRRGLVARPTGCAARRPQRAQLAALRQLVGQQHHRSSAAGSRGRLQAARAAAAEQEAAAAGALVPDRQGYRSFLMEGAEFLVAESADGKLDLSDVYVTTDVGSFSGFLRYREWGPGHYAEEQPCDDDGEAAAAGSSGSSGAVDDDGAVDVEATAAPPLLDAELLAGGGGEAAAAAEQQGELLEANDEEEEAEWEEEEEEWDEEEEEAALEARAAAFHAEQLAALERERPAPAYRRPEGLELAAGLPPRAYQAVPWYTKWDGNTVKEEHGRTWVWRYYLIPVAADDGSPAGYQLTFDEPWLLVLDGKSASIKRVEVHRLAPPDTPPADIRLRIRRDVVTVDSVNSLPDWEEVVQARIEGAPALSELERERLQAYFAALEEARKLGTLDEAEFETAFDVHWLAGMQAGGGGVEGLDLGWSEAAGSSAADGEFDPLQQDDVIGGWDADLLKDLLPDQYDEEELEEEGDDYDEFDTPAADY